MRAESSGRRSLITVGPPPNRTYRLAWRIGQILSHHVFRVTVFGEESVPLSGGLILASNHASYLDPPLVGYAAPRQCHYLAKRELFRVPLFGPLIRQLGAMPVRRGDLEPRVLRQLVEGLREERAFVLFPEGTRSRTGKLGRPRLGVGLFAREAQVPVLPLHIAGTAGWWAHAWLRPPVRVRFGTVVAPPPTSASRTQILRYVESLMDEIRRLGEVPADAASGLRL